MDIDDPDALELRHRIIQEKPFLRRIYQEWYEHLAAGVPAGAGAVLEIGAGAGFLREYLPEVIRSDVFPHPFADIVLDGSALPLPDGALRGIVMVNVFHHLAEPRRFFAEAARCVRPGGAMVMVEPWVTAWSRLVYTKLHHEPFQPAATEWEFQSTGPMSGANGALPWIVFERDRFQFEREFPLWIIRNVEIRMPFRYLLSGGLSMKSLVPNWSFGLCRSLDRSLQPWSRSLGMFAFIRLERRDLAHPLTA